MSYGKHAMKGQRARMSLFGVETILHLEKGGLRLLGRLSQSTK